MLISVSQHLLWRLLLRLGEGTRESGALADTGKPWCSPTPFMLTQPHLEADLGSAIYILMALFFFFLSTKKDMIFNTTYIAKIFQRQDEGEKRQ